MSRWWWVLALFSPGALAGRNAVESLVALFSGALAGREEFGNQKRNDHVEL
ncbi:MAG: hypothetical protein H7839_06075 [Magnetococcus sp. YQC-5]